MAAVRDPRGRFKRIAAKIRHVKKGQVLTDHNYIGGHVCKGDGSCENDDCPLFYNIKLGKHAERSGWKEGRRIVEFGVLLSNLSSCQSCRLGPIPLTFLNIVGELRKGLSGYIYVKCQNPDCGAVNKVPYGKTHHVKSKGMPCFVVNTKLGTSMIDSIGGPDRVNNFLSTLNIKPINSRSLKAMENRAGGYVVAVSKHSTRMAAKESFQMEMEDIAREESLKAQKSMGESICDLGVTPLPDASPSIRLLLSKEPVFEDEDISDNDEPENVIEPIPLTVPVSSSSLFTPPANKIQYAPRRHHSKKNTKPTQHKNRIRLSSKYPCISRAGMSCAVDTAWHKRGFDSLTSHTFFMSKAKYGKKVVKALVSHRTCGVCKWWKRNRHGQPVRAHRCVHSHSGSARLMESASGVLGVKQLSEEGTPVEYLEGDGDNTLIARLRSDLNMTMKKRFDRNHVVKNVGKRLYALHVEKGIKLSKIVILHIQKCLKYAFAKNQGDKDSLEKNLKALIPHQFGDHSLCVSKFCGFKRQPGQLYTHRSLPYKSALKDDILQERLYSIFKPIIANAEQYADLGSSQQCEHANREVTLRAPKSLHYGNSESLDYRVHATSAFINEGRKYISQVNTSAGISPGKYTVQYAEKQLQHRKQMQARAEQPATKRRRLILKQERVITQGAHEALEGVSYQSGIGHEANVDIEKLPDAVPRGHFKAIKLQSSEEPSFISFDLKTTDLIRGRLMPHLTQIAAVDLQSGRKFNTYVLPRVPLTAAAQQITGIVVNGSGSMTVNGTQVQPATIHSAIIKFCEWLEQFRHVFLVAHNGRKFDFPVFLSCLMSIGLVDKFCTCVSGFIDSLPVFKKCFRNQSSYKQEDLVRNLLNLDYDAHNAVEDVTVLGKLVSHTKLQGSELVTFSFSPLAVHRSLLFNKEKAKNIPSLHPLIAEGVLKMATAENIAGSGLNLSHLQKIYERDGEDGLQNTFTCANSDGLPRVTNVKRTLDDVIPKLVRYFQKKV